MHPQAIFGLDTFFLVLIVMLPPAVLYLAREMRKAGYSYTRFFAIQLGVAVVCLTGAKLFSLYLRDWQWVNISYELVSGWKYPGAALGVLIAVPVLVRALLPNYPVLRFCDKLVIVAAFCLAVFRLSCVMKGCCTGPICDGEFCITYAQGSAVWYEHLTHGHLANPESRSLSVMPLHLYFLLASLAVGIFLKWYEPRKSYDGQLVLLFLVLHEGSKAVLEMWRVPFSMEVQAVSLFLCAGALLMLLWNWRSRASD